MVRVNPIKVGVSYVIAMFITVIIFLMINSIFVTVGDTLIAEANNIDNASAIHYTAEHFSVSGNISTFIQLLGILTLLIITMYTIWFFLFSHKEEFEEV